MGFLQAFCYSRQHHPPFPLPLLFLLLQVLFHAAFLERAKAIIADCLQVAAGSIHEPLRAALKQAAAHTPEPAGQLQPGNWPSAVQLQGAGQLDRTYTALGGRSSSMAWAGGAQGGLGYSRSGQLLLGSLSGMVAGEAEPAGERVCEGAAVVLCCVAGLPPVMLCIALCFCCRMSPCAL